MSVGVVELTWEQVAALSVFLLALDVLLRFGDLRPADPLGRSKNRGL